MTAKPEITGAHLGKAAQWAVYRSSSIERLLARLERVKQTKPDQWIAKCPGHTDKSPSLSVKQCGDGTILLHDFGGCSPSDILAAVGMELADLFPERLKPQTPAERRAAREAFKRDSWRAALAVLAREATIVEIAAHDLADNKPLSGEDHERLLTAIARIGDAKAVLT